MQNALETATYREILNQPTAWRATLGHIDAALSRLMAYAVDSVVFTGCGSPHYLSQAVATVARFGGLSAVAAPASHVWLYPDAYIPADARLLVCVSRSGETTEVLEAARVFKARTGGAVLSITCNAGTALAGVSDETVVLAEAAEVSLAQTQSYTSMLLTASQLAAALAQDGTINDLTTMPDACQQVLDISHDLARTLGNNLSYQRFFFLGDAALYGIACEAMLKMKEMTLSYAEAYHFLEFRHGPMAMVDANTLVVGLVADEARPEQVKVLAEMRDMGADVLVISTGTVPAEVATHHVQLPTDLPTNQRLALYLPPLQLMACYRAVAKGLDPDTPSNLNAFVRLDTGRIAGEP
jgi:glutamine---fructose-6-phosphate transaminase (isomerizing)